MVPVAGRRSRGNLGGMIRFDVPGMPVPKGSNRAMVIRGRAFMVPGGDSGTQARGKTWDQNVRAAAKAAALAAGYDLTTPAFVETPLCVIVNFRLKRPAGHWNKAGLKEGAPTVPSTKPDIDKLARQILDAMTGIVYDDDSRISELWLKKLYADPGDEGADITVSEAR